MSSRDIVPLMRKYSGHAVTLAGLASLLLIACAETPEQAPSNDASSDAAASNPERPGIRFDPIAVRRGDSIGVLVVDSIDAHPNVVDSTYVGMARFSGRIELSGRTIPHFDSDLRHDSVCFEADSASAARLPRWLHDERRSWFCFSNPREAAQALGPPGAEADARIAVDGFVIHRGLSDQVNSARFVDLVAR